MEQKKRGTTRGWESKAVNRSISVAVATERYPGRNSCAGIVAGRWGRMLRTSLTKRNKLDDLQPIPEGCDASYRNLTRKGITPALSTF